MIKKNIKSVIISVFFSEFIALFLLVLLTLLTFQKPDPSVYSLKIGIASLFLGALFCGLLSSLISERKGISTSAIAGGAYCLLQIILSGVFSNNSFDITLALIKIVFSMGICILISYILSSRSARSKKRKRKMRSK